MADQIETIRPRVGVAVFVFKEGRVLLGKRKGTHGAGKWAPPGGHLEFGESVEGCARRELGEESALEALSVQTGLWSNSVVDESRHCITFFAVVEQFVGEPQLLEPEKCEGWHWFSMDALPDPLFPPAVAFFEKYSKAKAPHEQVLASLLECYSERDWEQFHSPKNLVMGLASEVGEVLDLFRWMTEEQSHCPDPMILQEIRDEVADVFQAVLYLAHKLNIDPIDAAFHKIEEMKRKYPVDKCRGKALKYTAYEVS